MIITFDNGLSNVKIETHPSIEEMGCGCGAEKRGGISVFKHCQRHSELHLGSLEKELNRLGEDVSLLRERLLASVGRENEALQKSVELRMLLAAAQAKKKRDGK